jgi:hypothetical protein
MSWLLKSTLACLLTAAATVAWLSMTSTPFGSLNVHSSFASTLGCPWTACDQVLGGGGVLHVCGGDGNGGSSSGNSGRILEIISA